MNDEGELRRETNLIGDRPLRARVEEEYEGDSKKVSDPFSMTKGSAGSYGKEDIKQSTGGVIIPSDIKVSLEAEVEEEDTEQYSKSQLRNEQEKNKAILLRREWDK